MLYRRFGLLFDTWILSDKIRILSRKNQVSIIHFFHQWKNTTATGVLVISAFFSIINADMHILPITILRSPLNHWGKISEGTVGCSKSVRAGKSCWESRTWIQLYKSESHFLATRERIRGWRQAGTASYDAMTWFLAKTKQSQYVARHSRNSPISIFLS